MTAVRLIGSLIPARRDGGDQGTGALPHGRGSDRGTSPLFQFGAAHKGRRYRSYYTVSESPT